MTARLDTKQAEVAHRLDAAQAESNRRFEDVLKAIHADFQEYRKDHRLVYAISAVALTISIAGVVTILVMVVAKGLGFIF